MWWRSTEIWRQWDGLHLDVDDVLIVRDELGQVAVDISRQVVRIRVGSDDQLGGDLKEKCPHGLAAAWLTVASVTRVGTVTDCERVGTDPQGAPSAGYNCHINATASDAYPRRQRHRHS